MNRRPYILIIVLAVAFVTMAWFIVSRNELPLSEMRSAALFGVLLVGIALVAVRKGSWVSSPASWSRSWPKYVFGSFALAFASWMLGSVLLLPVIGFAGFELMEKPWFGVGFCLLALAFFPLARRFMQ